MRPSRHMHLSLALAAASLLATAPPIDPAPVPRDPPKPPPGGPTATSMRDLFPGMGRKERRRLAALGRKNLAKWARCAERTGHNKPGDSPTCIYCGHMTPPPIRPPAT
jgi:hypothetical protein